jgi:23S rRNA (cytidine1920-2'-O)/16S rRNA (cytidine1409-2'-O)-methyltransferase
MTTIPKRRLDQRLVEIGLVKTRSQAESYIKLGAVTVDGTVILKSGYLVGDKARLKVTVQEQYVSRAALKLASVAHELNLTFNKAIVLDVGSSTGGFTDYALRHGASRVVAIELGTDQLHPVLWNDPRIELHEKTDIRDVRLANVDNNRLSKALNPPSVVLEGVPDIVVADVSFISLREILPHIGRLSGPKTRIVVMLKPQFEATNNNIKHNGVIKNDRLRRQIIKDFEIWALRQFVIVSKADSEVRGSKGNRERFYLLKKQATK